MAHTDPKLTQDHNYYTEWLNSAYGRDFYNTEINLLKANLGNIFGFHVLQIGSSELNYLELLSDKLKINHKLVLVDHKLSNNISNTISILNSKDNYIALDTQSIDAVIISHGLEFSQDPHGLLREVDRVLLPEGHLIILGFNPWSLWGLRKSLSFKTDNKQRSFPWDTKLDTKDINNIECHESTSKWLSCYRVCDWLNLLNYSISFKKHYFYQPCIDNQNILNYTKFFNQIGEIIPIGAAGFCIIATKKQEACELVRPNWRRTMTFVPKAGYIEPTMRLKK